MARNRVDDEEALIPRSDQGEYHPATPRKRKARCCCGVKCWFLLFFLLVVGTTVLFYFVYPAFVHENINKILGYVCTATSPVLTANVTCIILTTQDNQPARTQAVNQTWVTECSQFYFIYSNQPGNIKENSATEIVVKDASTTEYLSRVTRNNSATAWYLIADDTTYVSFGKLTKYLSLRDNTTAKYLGQNSKEDLTIPFVINYPMVKAILKDQTTNNFPKIGPQILKIAHESDGTPPDTDKLSSDIKIEEDLKNKVPSLIGVPVFHGVAPQDMYAFYVTGNHKPQ